MKESLLFRIQIVEELLSQMLPLLNKVSSNAWFVQQGRLEGIRPVRQQLEKWCVQYQSVLPDKALRELTSLTTRLNDWISSMGTSATPHNFASDDENSFNSLTKVLRKYQEQLYDELEQVPSGGTMVNIDKSVNIGTRLQHVNITGNIQDAFNTIITFGQANPNSDLKLKLEELCALVNQLIAQLPDQKAEEVSRDLKTLVTEAASAQPRRKWYELSGESLLEAAKTCAEMVAPISTAVKGVLALLG